MTEYKEKFLECRKSLLKIKKVWYLQTISFFVVLCFAIYSINYGLNKNLGLILPISLSCFAIVLLVLGNKSLKKRYNSICTEFKAFITDKGEQEYSQVLEIKKIIKEFDNISVKPERNQIIATGLSVLIVLCPFFYIYENAKVFNPQKWKATEDNRLIMVENLLLQLDTENPYNIKSMSREDINAIFYDSKIESLMVDISVKYNEEALISAGLTQSDVDFDIYYVCTNKNGEHYWLVVLYYCGTCSNAELMKSGMTRVYSGDRDINSPNYYGEECRLWY